MNKFNFSKNKFKCNKNKFKLTRRRCKKWYSSRKISQIKELDLKDKQSYYSQKWKRRNCC